MVLCLLLSIPHSSFLHCSATLTSCKAPWGSSVEDVQHWTQTLSIIRGFLANIPTQCADSSKWRCEPQIHSCFPHNSPGSSWSSRYQCSLAGGLLPALLQVRVTEAPSRTGSSNPESWGLLGTPGKKDTDKVRAVERASQLHGGCPSLYHTANGFRESCSNRPNC